MNVILIGYRGSGKTTLGRKLADQLWKTFVDVDDGIRARFANKTITRIWNEDGERAYRDTEVAVTRELCRRDDQVIGLGGGTLMESGAREAVEQADAVRIYLKCDPEELNRRIDLDGQSAASRPSLTGLGGGIDEIVVMLEKREPVYEAVADKIFDVTHVGPDDALRYLIKNCL